MGSLRLCRPNAAPVQLAHQFNQVFERAPKPVEFPNHDYIAGPSLTQQSLQFKAVRLRSTDLLLKNTLASRLLQGINLQMLTVS